MLLDQRFTSLSLFSFLQITKATAKFLKWNHTGDWGFEDWNTWRMKDGMLCRTTNDCSWLDKDLFCQRIVRAEAWFGGNYSNIFGRCECREGMEWDTDELECLELEWTEGAIFGLCMIGLIGLALICCIVWMNWIELSRMTKKIRSCSKSNQNQTHNGK